MSDAGTTFTNTTSPSSGSIGSLSSYSSRSGELPVASVLVECWPCRVWSRCPIAVAIAFGGLAAIIL